MTGRKTPDDGKPDDAALGQARSRLLETLRQCFAREARAKTPSPPISLKSAAVASRGV